MIFYVVDPKLLTEVFSTERHQRYFSLLEDLIFVIFLGIVLKTEISLAGSHKINFSKYIHLDYYCSA